MQCALQMGANGNLEEEWLSTIGAIGFSYRCNYNDPLCFDDDSPMPCLI